MTIGVLKEQSPETRVSFLPEHVAALKKSGINVSIENDAGENSFASNDKYSEAGATINSREDVIKNSSIILCIHAPQNNELEKFSGKILIGVYNPLFYPENIELWKKNNITIFSLDRLPRTTRAQSMDVLSSQANIAGYKAVLKAADVFPGYFPMFMTAAGSIPPVKVLILGAGVAGLQAIATARRLGAVVEVFDTRPAVKEEVMSLGAKFVEVEGAADASASGGYAVEQTPEFLSRQKQRIAEAVLKSDVIITTAQIPGKKAPILIEDNMLASMKNGSVIIDLAASSGGNTPFTKNNETIIKYGVRIVGDSNLPALMPKDASKLYGKNVSNFLQLIIKDVEVHLNFEDDLVKNSCICFEGN